MTTEPIYFGTINNAPVRFYPPQTSDDMMPWCAIDDLVARVEALGIEPAPAPPTN
jgi:hypothetical protein